MSKSRVTVKFALTPLLNRVMTGPQKDELGRAVVEAAKEMIASGQSPVAGKGRFVGYSDGYKDRIKGSLGTKYGKTTRPVNLTLSGDMLDSYSSKVNGPAVQVGIMARAGSDIEKRATAHNNGEGNMPRRQMVPGSGEVFAPRIMRLIKGIYSAVLRAIIDKSNK